MTARVSNHKRFGVDAWIARWYTNMTSKDMDRHDSMARRVTESVADGSSILEVAPGPGYVAINLAKTGRFEVKGLDINPTFVEIARQKAAESGVHVDFLEGNVTAMPFGDEEFDYIVCCAAFKNFTEPVRALQEMYRVLRPGGKALVNDLCGDITDQVAAGEMNKINEMNLSNANQRFVRIIFRHILTKRAYTKAQFEDFVSQTEFSGHIVRDGSAQLDIELHKQ